MQQQPHQNVSPNHDTNKKKVIRKIRRGMEHAVPKGVRGRYRPVVGTYASSKQVAAAV
jgi:hypothetical protein